MAAAPEQLDGLNRQMRRFLIWAIGVLTAGYTFLDYWAYSRVQHEDPRSWVLLLTGKGLAPAQYRIGIYETAGVLATLTHLQLRHVFACIDLVCVGLALACIFFLLTRLLRFRAASAPAQWAQLFLALLLTEMYLAWTFWFQEPETMPSLALLAVSAVLCSGALRAPRAIPGLSLVLLAALGATVRVDTVTALEAGMLLVCLDGARRGSRQTWLTVASAAALCAALAVGYSISHILFPHAPRSAPLWQLLNNLRAVTGTLALLCTLPPWVLTIWLAVRRWAELPLWSRGIVVASGLHFAMFLNFGMTEEVRIFIPFMMTLIPLSATLLYAWLAGSEMQPGEGT